MVVGTFFWNKHANALFFTKSIIWLEGQASAAIVPRGAAFWNSDTRATILAPGLSLRADTNATIIVIVGTFLRYQNTSVEGWAKTVFWEVGQTLAAVVVGGTALWDLHTFVSCGAKAKSCLADFDACFSIFRDFIAIHTIAALMEMLEAPLHPMQTFRETEYMHWEIQLRRM